VAELLPLQQPFRQLFAAHVASTFPEAARQQLAGTGHRLSWENVGETVGLELVADDLVAFRRLFVVEDAFCLAAFL
jgi:hypothetical protein